MAQTFGRIAYETLTEADLNALPVGTIETRNVGYFEWLHYARSGPLAAAGVKGTQQAVAFALASYGDTRTGKNVRPGRETIAKGTDASVRTVTTTMQALQAAGFLALVKAHAPNRPAVYRLCVPVDLEAPADELEPDALAGVPDVGDKDDQAQPDEPERAAAVPLVPSAGSTAEPVDWEALEREHDREQKAQREAAQRDRAARAAARAAQPYVPVEDVWAQAERDRTGEPDLSDVPGFGDDD